MEQWPSAGGYGNVYQQTRMTPMKRSWIAVGCLLLPAVVSHATTVWDAIGAAPLNWNVSANWTAGVPVASGDGPTKAVFNRSGRAECEVTDARALGQLVQGDNGPGGVVRIRSGGSLTSGNNWTAIGYNRDARMIVETGGALNCASHLWIGYTAPAVGRLDIAGGTVNVTGQLGLGWSGGTGHVSVTNEGILNLTQFDATLAISGASSLDIGAGSVVIQGDRTNAVRDYIAAGKIIGFGGSGTPVVDYNISHPGKTTVTAIPTQIAPAWRVATTQNPTDDWVITPFDAAADFGIIANGETDMTQEIQSALVVISNLGGGALFLPAGHYKIAGNLVIPSAVTLRGDWRKPGPGEAVTGTVLMAYAGRDDENAAPFITLNNSAGVNGLSFWYPEQTAGDIRPYPPTIGNGGGATVENVTFVNSYWGYTTFVNGTTARPFLRNLCGTPLKLGIEFDCLADIGRIETVHFSPTYWSGSGLPGAPTAGEHMAWIHQNGTGIIVRRIDWSYSCYVTIEGYAIGLALRPGRHDGKFPNGQSYGFRLLGCRTGIEIEASAYAGYQFTRFEILNAETGIRLSPATSKSTMFHSCLIEASRDALLCEGLTARVLMMSCDIRRGALKMDGGYLSVSHSDFAADQPVHLELGGEVRGATILGNRFPNGARILSRTHYPVHVNHTPLPVEPMPDYDFRKPATPPRPAKSDLFVVTAAPFHAQANGVTNDTAAFQGALAAAAANGGGTVFAPGGSYRLNGNLTVPAGVELRGIFDTPNDTKVKGSLLNVYAGRNQPNGTPFIQLQGGAGIRGFTFHYPEQIYNSTDTVNFGMVPYPFLIRGLGADIHAVNLSATIPYQLLDLAMHRCDRHYIDYIFATALKTGIQVGGGSEDGQIHNCQFNPSSYTHAGAFYDSIPFGTANDIHKIQWRDATPYRFGHVTGQVLHQNFVFGGWLGFHLVAENGHGPSGHCLGMGVDQCTIAMRIDAIGSGDLQPINSQLVTVDTDKGRYLETGASLGNQVFRMFSSAGWGGHQYSAVISGGDVRLQLFHLARDGEAGVFQVLNQAKLNNIGGNLDDYLASGRPFLSVAPAASALFAGNIINTTAGQMPANPANVTSIGNLRFGAAASGADITWTNGNGNRAWNVAGNWDGGVPGGTSAASIASNAVPGPVIASGTNGNARKLVMDGRLEMTGGSLTTGEWMVLGYGAGNHGAFEINTGSVTIGNELIVGLYGTGAVAMAGGSLTVSGMLALAPNPGSNGTVTLSGGTLQAGTLSISQGGGINLNGGTLLLAGDVTAQISAYAAKGRITAMDGAGVLKVEFNTSHPGKTSVTASLPPPATSYWLAPGAGSWTVPSHWSGGAAPLDPAQHLKVIFNVVGAGPCVLGTTATVAHLVMGDNSAAHDNQLSLAAGADLTAGFDAFGRTTWTAVGYNRGAKLSVETGAVLRCRNHLWIGYLPPAVGTLDLNGGTAQVAGQFGLGWEGGTGTVTLRNGGTLDLDRIDATRSISGNSSINLRAGSIVIRGNQLSAIQGYINGGKVLSYGGSGTVLASYDAGTNLTTVSSAGAPTGFDAWVDEWKEPIGGPGDDPDGDGHNNLHEYALNGNPADASDRGGVAPRLELIGGIPHFRHLVRKGDAVLVYTVQSSTDLSPTSWSDAALGETAIVSWDADYNEAIHPVAAGGDRKFFRLKIFYP
jgi:hypothetical protein